jgi:hypothetical protein
VFSLKKRTGTILRLFKYQMIRHLIFFTGHPPWNSEPLIPLSDIRILHRFTAFLTNKLFKVNFWSYYYLIGLELSGTHQL